MTWNIFNFTLDICGLSKTRPYCFQGACNPLVKHILIQRFALPVYIYIYIIVEKSPNSSHMYDHGFDCLTIGIIHETMVVHMTWVWTFFNNYSNHPRMCVLSTLCGNVDKHSPFIGLSGSENKASNVFRFMFLIFASYFIFHILKISALS